MCRGRVTFCAFVKLGVPPPALLTRAMQLGLVSIPQIGFCFVVWLFFPLAY